MRDQTDALFFHTQARTSPRWLRKIPGIVFSVRHSIQYDEWARFTSTSRSAWLELEMAPEPGLLQIARRARYVVGVTKLASCRYECSDKITVIPCVMCLNGVDQCHACLTPIRSRSSSSE